MTGHDREVPKRRRASWSLVLVLALIPAAGRSSGWFSGSAKRLAWDPLYGVLVVYYPLLIFGQDSFTTAYIEWWVVDVFHTVGPG